MLQSAPPSAIEFVLRSITDDTQRIEGKIPFDNPCGFDDWISRGISDGSFSVCYLHTEGKEVGQLIYRVSHDRENELVIVALHTYEPIFNTLVAADIFATRLAEKLNVKHIRFHTLRAGLVKESLKLGFRVSEFVLRKDL